MDVSVDYFDYLTADAPRRYAGDHPSLAIRIRRELISTEYFGKPDNSIRTLMFFELALLTGCLIDDLCQ